MKRPRSGASKGSAPSSGAKASSSLAAASRGSEGSGDNMNIINSGGGDGARTGAEAGDSKRSSVKEDELLSQMNSYIDGSSDATSGAGSFYALQRALAAPGSSTESGGASAHWAGLMDRELASISSLVASAQQHAAGKAEAGGGNNAGGGGRGGLVSLPHGLAVRRGGGGRARPRPVLLGQLHRRGAAAAAGPPP